jgi:RND family efflux transporter MFP subunit
LLKLKHHLISAGHHGKVKYSDGQAMSAHFRFLLFCLSLACLSPCQAEQSLALTSAQMKALGLEVRLAGEAGGTRAGTLPARVLVPVDQARVVAAPVAGILEALNVAPGSSVKRGQVLARLASPQALELQRDAVQAGSQSALLQQSLKRDEQLFAEGLIAESRLQATRAAATQAAALAAERRQSLALAGGMGGKNGGALVLTAPIDGVVLEQGAQLGQRVEASTLLYRIARLFPLWLEIQAPVDLAAGLREGGAVKLAGSEVSGRLIAIGRAVDATSQTVLLRAEVSKGAETLRPGQVVEVELAAVAGKAVSVPAAALVRHGGETLLFVQTGADAQGSRFAPRPVRVLAQGGDSVRVEGVEASEKIAVKGISGLKAMLAGVGKE